MLAPLSYSRNDRTVALQLIRTSSRVPTAAANQYVRHDCVESMEKFPSDKYSKGTVVSVGNTPPWTFSDELD